MTIELKKTIECDDKIAPIILKLWEKGYITKACCQGHKAGEKFDWASKCYIAFCGNYDFYKVLKGTIPEGFYVKVFNEDCWAIYEKEKSAAQGTDRSIEVLKKWVETIPEAF